METGAERLDGDTVFDPTTDGVPNAEPAVTLDAETLAWCDRCAKASSYYPVTPIVFEV